MRRAGFGWAGYPLRGTPWALGAAVGHLATVHALGDDAKLHADASDRGGFLRGEHAAHMLGNPLGGHLAALGNGGSERVSKLLILHASLARRVRLGARLGDAGVHLAQHLGDLGHVLAASDGDGQGVSAGDGVLLGHGEPLSVSGG